MNLLPYKQEFFSRICYRTDETLGLLQVLPFLQADIREVFEISNKIAFKSRKWRHHIWGRKIRFKRQRPIQPQCDAEEQLGVSEVKIQGQVQDGLKMTERKSCEAREGSNVSEQKQNQGESELRCVKLSSCIEASKKQPQTAETMPNVLEQLQSLVQYEYNIPKQRQPKRRSDVLMDRDGQQALAETKEEGHEFLQAFAEARREGHELLQALAEARREGHQFLQALAEARQEGHQFLQALAEARQEGHQFLQALAGARQEGHEFVQAFAAARQEGPKPLLAPAEAGLPEPLLALTEAGPHEPLPAPAKAGPPEPLPAPAEARPPEPLPAPAEARPPEPLPAPVEERLPEPLPALVEARPPEPLPEAVLPEPLPALVKTGLPELLPSSAEAGPPQPLLALAKAGPPEPLPASAEAGSPEPLPASAEAGLEPLLEARLEVEKKQQITEEIIISEDQHEKKGKKSTDQTRKPNYFVSIPITNDQILDKIEDVQELIVTKEAKLLKALIPADKAHLTIIVAHLPTEEEVEKAISALLQCKLRVEAILQGKPLNMTFHGIGQFNGQVIYVKMAESEQKMLGKIAESVANCFLEMGIDVTGSKEFKPHLTFLKLSKAPFLRRKGFRKICSDLYKEYEDSAFGIETFSRIDLCSMHKKQKEPGYYYCESSIQVGPSSMHFGQESQKVDPEVVVKDASQTGALKASEKESPAVMVKDSSQIGALKVSEKESPANLSLSSTSCMLQNILDIKISETSITSKEKETQENSEY
ncbi:formin BNR1 [Microcaecilia unicolor]|uniref:Formin BNR1-like n=1 Tax=Microcaecilia unicolor TaxID=1415580 RepID=A0A6P7WPX3_9AMPH|nr:formin BNR1-like [Microcaecilia unicolor]